MLTVKLAGNWWKRTKLILLPLLRFEGFELKWPSHQWTKSFRTPWSPDSSKSWREVKRVEILSFEQDPHSIDLQAEGSPWHWHWEHNEGNPGMLRQQFALDATVLHHTYPISDLLDQSPLTCQNAWMWLGDPFKGNQDPSHIEGWDLEMIEVESWKYRLKCESGWKGFSWIWNDKSRRSLVVRPSKICGLPAKLRFLLHFCKSAAAPVQKCANCPVSLHSPAQRKHLRWTMTIMIKSYDDRYDKHCSW